MISFWMIGCLATVLVSPSAASPKPGRLPPFHERINSPYFIDRTLFIKEFFDEPKRIMAAAPRGFGKSSNIEMLLEFAQIDVNPDGSMKNNPITHKNYPLFSQIVPNTGKHLNIFQDRQFFNRHFGKYPCIYLDFDKLKLKDCKCLDDVLKDTVVREAFKKHAYLLKSCVLSTEDKAIIKRFLGPAIVNRLTASAGISFLQLFLFKHFGRKPVMLIGEFNAPLKDMILEEQVPEENVHSLITELRQFALEALNQPIIDSVLITSCNCMDFKYTNQLNMRCVRYTQGDSALAKFFRVTQDQVDVFARKENLSEDDVCNIQLWYGGYRVELSGEEFYNIYSITNFFEQREFKPYWIDGAQIRSFTSMFMPQNLGETLKSLAHGKVARMFRPVVYVTERILELKEFSLRSKDSGFTPKYGGEVFFLRFMYDHGYFITVGQSKNFCKAPNYEVREILERFAYDGLKLKGC